MLGTIALLILLVISTYVGRAMIDMAKNEMPMDKRCDFDNVTHV